MGSPPRPQTRAAWRPRWPRFARDASRRLSRERLRRKFVSLGADADVVRARPFALADEWGQDRREVLRAFLHAVPAGLFELRWGLICPSCLTASDQARSHEERTTQGHCQLCDISFDLDLDRAVEATFQPHPAIRRVPEALFCMGGPGRTPHVLVQTGIESGATRALEVPRGPGRYRVVARGGAMATLEVDEAGATSVDATLSRDGIDPVQLHATPGGELRIANHCGDGRHVKIERLGFASAAATAHIVSTLDEFRSLFAKDLLKRGTPLKVARAAILFSDLTGSTALYTKVGDAAAFRLVDDHFDVLRAAEPPPTTVRPGQDDGRRGHGCPHRRQAGAPAPPPTPPRASASSPGQGQTHGALVGTSLGLYAGACYVVTANGAL